MKACQYQDVPGRRSLCLRVLSLAETADLGKARWTLCDDDRNCSCPHRSWDLERREDVRSFRMVVLDRCQACGGPHDSIMEMMVCRMENDVSAAISPCPPPLPEGSGGVLLRGNFPSSVRQMAWRRVRKAVMDRDEHRCRECGRDLLSLPSWYGEVHHILPRIAGGGDRPENLVTLCVECHGRHTDELCSNRLRNGSIVERRA